MNIVIKKAGSKFIASCAEASFKMGIGSTMDAAIGDYLRNYQNELGVNLVIDASCKKTETERKRRQLSTQSMQE
jgi:hypothetical protein